MSARGRLGCLVVCLWAMALVAGCGEPAPADDGAQVQSSAQMVSYPSVEALSTAADAVVVAVKTDRVEQVEDDGGIADGPALPMVYYGYEVRQVVAGSLSRGAEILVGQTDVDRIEVDQEEDAGLGKDRGAVLLFLSEIAAGDAPAVAHLGTTYVPKSARNGVFDIDPATEMSTPRSAVVTSLVGEGGEIVQGSGAPGWPLGEVLRTVRQSTPAG